MFRPTLLQAVYCLLLAQRARQRSCPQECQNLKEQKEMLKEKKTKQTLRFDMICAKYCRKIEGEKWL